ncbi:MAG: serine/threonine-protein kinase [Acidobacteriota bacterium]
MTDDTTPLPGDDATPLPDDDATPLPDDPTPSAPPLAQGSPTQNATPPSTQASGADEPRFVPGTVLAERYRIVGMLGRGGMGEVYRADDLKLGQSVALKFLPRGFEDDPERLRRFLDEARVALKITHPNVCRVYDLGEVDGAHYLSMEYIDGEDLASLLRRIGRLPEDKAIEIARQLCAGLAAAHDQGILHRDLKPANVMLDGRGEVKITDFGLAGLAEGFSGLEIRAGTPAFMAPEQLAGKEVTVRSDLYALGLVLYQLFTGKRAFAGQSLAELSALQHSGPVSPSSHVTLLDPSVEQVILRCLAPEPEDRPASALKVALGLPGGDPLAAALAAGETPSPDMVAEAGDDSGLEPRIALAVMAFAILGLLVASWSIGRYELLGRSPMELPPQVLAHRAYEITQALGYTDPPADRAYRFRSNWPLLQHVAKDPSPDRWDRLATDRPTPIYMWYRQSPRTLIPFNRSAMVDFNDPPFRTTGMVSLFLDTSGRLKFFQAVPPQRDTSPPDPTAVADWSVAFEAADLDPARFEPTAPHWLPETYCDARSAWLGSYREGDGEIRVEACSYRGRPVLFSIVSPWARPFNQQPPDLSSGQKLRNSLNGLLAVVVILSAILLVHRNLRLGRGDRQGALVLAASVVIARMGAWVFQGSHVSDPFRQIDLFSSALGHALYDGGTIWLFYLALEPFVRRRWPESLVSWNRLLAGRIRDPLVGRHVLYGAALGVGMALIDQLGDQAPRWFGGAPARPNVTDLDTLLGTHWVIGEFFFSLRHALVDPMSILFLLVLARVLLRNAWLASAAFVAIFVFNNVPQHEMAWIAGIALTVTSAAIVIFMTRFGLVTLVAAYFFINELASNQPLTLDFSTWYAGSSLTALAVGIAVIVFAFRTSLAGRPLLPESE